jgi:MoaA/NifB/PqqE/SkfB family radical SAM enzyme
MRTPGWRRAIRRWEHRWRLARAVAQALQTPERPILAQLVPIRRCNLACTYCNEFDKTSAPVPTATIRARIDRLADLGTLMVDLSGGEPLLHPHLEELVAHVRRQGMLAGLLTNGYLLTRARIRQLNDAGLDHLQISIDNVEPDAVSHKSLKVLDSKLQWLAEEALFEVQINSVLGGGTRAEDVLAIARRARQLGFGFSVGLVHTAGGALKPLGPAERRVYEELTRLPGSFYSLAPLNLFQDTLAAGEPSHWHCPAGGRYLYVCEDGLVHWCSQQRGRPAIPLEHYTRAELARERERPKACAPYCTISCVRRTAVLDELGARPRETIDRLLQAYRVRGGRVPTSVRALTWLFVTGPARAPLSRAARWWTGALPFGSGSLSGG